MGQGMHQGMGQNYSNQSSAKRYSQELMRQRNLSNNHQNLSNHHSQNGHHRFQNKKSILRENYKDKKISVNTCLDICDHIKGCPICSKFYNTDKTIYIVIIIILCLVILILLKKVLKI